VLQHGDSGQGIADNPDYGTAPSARDGYPSVVIDQREKYKTALAAKALLDLAQVLRLVSDIAGQGYELGHCRTSRHPAKPLEHFVKGNGSIDFHANTLESLVPDRYP